MAVRSSDAVPGRFGCLLSGPLRRLRERAARARQTPKDASGAEVEAPRATGDAGSRPRAASASADSKIYTFQAESLLTAQFGLSSHRGPESLGGPTVEAPTELEVPHSLAAGGHSFAAERVSPAESHGSCLQAGAASVLGSARDSPHLCGLPTSRSAIEEYVPYLNAATNKPCYLDSPAPTSAPDSREGSFQSHGDEDEDNNDADADVLSVMDRGQVAPYLEDMLTSLDRGQVAPHLDGMLTSSVDADISELVPYLNALTGKPCYLDSLAPSRDSEGSEADPDSRDAAPHLEASTPPRRACPYLQ